MTADEDPGGCAMSERVEKRLEQVVEILSDRKAEDIVSIKLTSTPDIADYIVIASGQSGRHVRALLDHLSEGMKKAEYPPISVEGQESCDWIVVDLGAIIVHLFRPEVRLFYNLEKLWMSDFESLDDADVKDESITEPA